MEYHERTVFASRSYGASRPSASLWLHGSMLGSLVWRTIERRTFLVNRQPRFVVGLADCQRIWLLAAPGYPFARPAQKQVVGRHSKAVKRFVTTAYTARIAKDACSSPAVARPSRRLPGGSA